MNTKNKYDDNTREIIVTYSLIALTSIIITATIALLFHKRVNDAHDDGWVEGYEEAKRDFQNDLKLQKKQYKKIVEDIKNNEANK